MTCTHRNKRNQSPTLKKKIVLNVPDGHKFQEPLKHRRAIGNGRLGASLIFQSK